MNKDLISRITINPKIMAGKPVIKGTRIPIDLILKMLSQNISIDEILAEYPRLCKEDIQTALLYGSIVISEPVLLAFFNPP
ncbi:TPA: DUF433 domain-containing protein [Candidatus Poribacteria bacterium]|nr:DUF433 domain-containing protein [Candidatus Poribacteria bacterium]